MTSDERTVIWSIARQVAQQDLSYGILRKNLAYPTDSNDGTTIIACYRQFCGLSRSACSSPLWRLLSRTGDQLGWRTGPRRCRRRAVPMGEGAGGAYRLRARARPREERSPWR